MEKWFYHYVVKYWDDIHLCMRTEHGFACSKTYAEAVSDISAWYGDEEIDSLIIETIDEGDRVLTIDKIICTLGKDMSVYQDNYNEN